MVRVIAVLLLCAFTIPTVQAEPPSSPALAWKIPKPRFPVNNPYSEAKANLGKQLFFDHRLSGKTVLACAHCHHPGLGWADGLPRALGSKQGLSRHTPSIINVAFARSLFWDGRAKSLENAVKQHLLMHGIMGGGSAEEVEERVNALAAYRRQFLAIFPENGITLGNIAAAIATYIRTIIFNDSPFDRWLQGERSAISESAKRGFALFTGKARCARCHTPPAFTDSTFHNTGINSVDPGHYEVSNDNRHRNAFKTPGLRHVAVTAPYMHNGSKSTLEEVIDFYDRGGDKPGENNELVPLHLNEQEKQDLLAFLKSLTNRTQESAVPMLPASGKRHR